MVDLKTCSTCGGLYLDFDSDNDGKPGLRPPFLRRSRTLGIFPVSIVAPPPTRPIPADIEFEPTSFCICFCNSSEDLEPSPEIDR